VLLVVAAMLVVRLSTDYVVQAAGTDLFVSPNAGGDCTQLAPCDLQVAIGLAQDGDSIYLAQGTYTGTFGYVATLADSVALLGGWDGTGTVPPVRDSDAYTSTIDGEGVRTPIYVNGNLTVTLDGLHLINGWAPGNGGGVYAYSARLLISDTRVYSNVAGGGGGGISMQNSPWVKLLGNEIYSNTSLGSGAGALVEDAEEVTLIDNHVYLNTVTGQYSEGGGLYIATISDTLIVNNDIYSNVSGIGGGGISIYEAPGMLIDNNRVYANRAETTSSLGGGIDIGGSSTITLTGNTVYDNEADNGAGIGLNLSDRAVVEDNDIYSNTAEGLAGGVYLNKTPTSTLTSNAIYDNRSIANGGGVLIQQSPNVSLTGNSVYGNWAENAGGIEVNQSNGAVLSDNWITNNTGTNLGAGGGIRIVLSLDVWLKNNIVAGNQLTGTRSGAGVAMLNSSSGHFLHTTLARNTGGNGQAVFAASSSMLWMTNTILVSHTVGVGTTSGAVVNMEATLWGDGAWSNIVDLAGPGIYTGTVNIVAEPAFIDPDAGDYHILNHSGALNQGIDAGVALDFEGELRVGAPDLGADEFLSYVYLPLVIMNW
jgi:hypothetical protein